MSGLEARDFLTAVAGFAAEAQANDDSIVRPVRLAVVDAGYAGVGTPRVRFEGETTTGLRTYVWLGNKPVAGDRVVMQPVGNSYVISGIIGGGVLSQDGRPVLDTSYEPAWSGLTDKPLGYPEIPRNASYYTPTRAASDYPMGVSTTFVDPNSGWPHPTNYGQVLTVRGFNTGSGDATIQYWSSYQNTDTAVYYRQDFYNVSGWTAWKKLATGIEAATGSVTISLSGSGPYTGSANVTYPAGRFSGTPSPSFAAHSGSPQSGHDITFVPNGTTGMTINYSRGTNFSTAIYWAATYAP